MSPQILSRLSVVYRQSDGWRYVTWAPLLIYVSRPEIALHKK